MVEPDSTCCDDPEVSKVEAVVSCEEAVVPKVVKKVFVKKIVSLGEQLTCCLSLVRSEPR